MDQEEFDGLVELYHKVSAPGPINAYVARRATVSQWFEWLKRTGATWDTL